MFSFTPLPPYPLVLLSFFFFSPSLYFLPCSPLTSLSLLTPNSSVYTPLPLIDPDVDCDAFKFLRKIRVDVSVVSNNIFEKRSDEIQSD
jgi:hypothetical protein